jgi:hypothetical protein
MKNMNKKFAVMLVFVLAISMLMVGCGNKNTKESTTANQGAMTDVNSETISNKEEVTTEKISTEGETDNNATANTDTNASYGYSNGNTNVSVSHSVGTSESTSKGTSSSVSTSKSSGNTSESAGISISTNTGKQEIKTEEPKTNPTTTPTQTQTPTPTSTQTPASENKENGLTSLSTEELNNLLDEIYPGDNLTQEWIDKLPAEKMYEYLGQKYQDDFNGYIRKDGKVIDDSTVECNVIVQLLSGGTKTHKLRLQVNDNRWSVIGDEEVK